MTLRIRTITVGVDNCYLIQDDGLILVDGGTAKSFEDFKKGIKQAGVDPKDISAVAITHCHWDHIGCAKLIRDYCDAKVIVHENEREFLEQGIYLMPPYVTRWGRILGPMLDRWGRKLPLEPCEADVVVAEETFSLADFGIRGQIVSTPGHSAGSMSILLDSGDALVGDMAMNALPMTIRPSLPIFAEDVSTLRQSWRKLLDMGAKHVHPGHGKSFPAHKLAKALA